MNDANAIRDARACPATEAVIGDAVMKASSDRREVGLITVMRLAVDWLHARKYAGLAAIERNGARFVLVAWSA